ncbi:hypothetical protein BGW38_003984, partial [Lunasporangiospora selenospora]
SSHKSGKACVVAITQTEWKRRRLLPVETLNKLTDDDNDVAYPVTAYVDQKGSDPNDKVSTGSDCDISEENYEDAGPRRATSKPADNGDLDCSEAVRSSWVVRGVDLIKDLNCIRLPTNPSISNPLQLDRAINHIYLFEMRDSTSSLYAAVGSKLWEAATDSLLDLGEKAIQFSLLSLQEAEDSVISNAGGNKNVRRLLTALFSSGFLWGDQYYNEAELINNLEKEFPLRKNGVKPTLQMPKVAGMITFKG